jgi:hypothetical protein
MTQRLVMPTSARARYRDARKAAAGQDGYVMIVVMLLLLIGLAIGAAALAEALASRSHANLDARQRRALQAADAGVQAVLYRENQLDLGSLDLTGGSGVLGTIADCLVPNLSTGLPANNLIALSVATGGACPIGQKNGANVLSSTTVPIGNHDSYNAEFIPSAKVSNSTSGVQFIGGKIISIGVDDNGNTHDPQQKVYERVQASLAPVDPFRSIEANHDLTFDVTAITAFNGTARAGHKLFFNAGLLGVFTGTNILGPSNNIIGPTSIDVGCQGNAGTNNAYTLTGLIFVPAVLGGINVANPQTCSSPYWFTRQPISILSSKPDCPSGVTCTSLPGYTASTDSIKITTGAQLTLAPGDYVFCGFQTNGAVNVTATASSAPVRIFIDNPNSNPRCSGATGNFSASQGIGGLVGGITGTLTPSQVQVYVVGNGTNDGTSVTSTGSVANSFFLYAPTSNVKVTSTVSFAGTVIGYDVEMSTILYTQDLGLNNYPVSSSLGTFHVSQYTQCQNTVSALTGTPASDASGC